MFGCLVAKSCPILLEVRGLQSTRLVPLCVRLSTKILKWVAISFSRESSPPREGIRVSCIGRRILYHRATGEAQSLVHGLVLCQGQEELVTALERLREHL